MNKFVSEVFEWKKMTQNVIVSHWKAEWPN